MSKRNTTTKPNKNKGATIHGCDGTLTNRSWKAMRQRCLYPSNDHDRKNYLERGIQVCDRWLHGENGEHPFVCFLKDVGERPSKDFTIDRKDNDGHYEPSNCYWATKEQQQNNKRNNVLLTFEGKTQTVAQWAKEKGINKETLLGRLNTYKWSVEKALSTPVNIRFSHQKNRRNY